MAKRNRFNDLSVRQGPWYKGLRYFERNKPMVYVRLMLAGLSFGLLSGCQPNVGGPGSAPPGASQADYERHKANRESYLYEGL
jgi:hypothetical protein